MTDRPTTGRPEHRWPVVAFTTVIIVLWALLPDDVQFLPRWIIPTIVIAMAVVLIIVNPLRFSRETTWSRPLSIGLAFGLALINQAYVVLLVIELVADRANGPDVLLVAFAVWITNVIAFAIVYWELDDGGPYKRRMEVTTNRQEDFLFPQETVERLQPWQPEFFDYVYFSLSNMTAFSPTDVMPLSTRAKAFMGYQALTGFVLLALIISRAVNILTMA